MPDRLSEENLRNRLAARLETLQNAAENSALSPSSHDSSADTAGDNTFMPNMSGGESLIRRIRRRVVLQVLPRLGLTTYAGLQRAYLALNSATAENETLRSHVDTLMNERTASQEVALDAVIKGNQRLYSQMNDLLSEFDALKADLKSFKSEMHSYQETNAGPLESVEHLLTQIAQIKERLPTATTQREDAGIASEILGLTQPEEQSETVQQFSLPGFATVALRNNIWDAVPYLGTLDDDDAALSLALAQAFRGPVDIIKERQSHYLPYLHLPNIGGPVLDVGCGRGEFLSLLYELNVPTTGIDLNSVGVERLRQSGYDVHHADAIDYLEGLADNSLGGLTAFQVIEHMPKDYLRRFLQIAWRKLALGAFILLETVNPYCLSVYRTFYLDPTHEAPVPSDLLSVLMTLYGFKELRLFYQSPIPYNGVPNEHEWAFYYLDYALMGIKQSQESTST